MDGEEWSRTNQKKFQVLLIQHKVYGFGEPQFLSDLSSEHSALMDNPEPITYEQAEAILNAKDYVGGGDMRGRQSFNPLEKMGLAVIDDRKRIVISSFGHDFLKDDYDLGNTFFRSYIKWQLPNPDSRDFSADDGYAVKPFIATLHLIREVNRLSQASGKKPVGINKQEFAIFVPTLINFSSIKEVAQKIVDFRVDKSTAPDPIAFIDTYHRDYVAQFLDSNDTSLIESTLSNTIEYADNIIRYFRLTRYFHIRGNGFYIDLESRRMIEIESLLSSDDASPKSFSTRSEYSNYLSDVTQPVLPWETTPELRRIIEALSNDVKSFITDLRSKSVAVPALDYKDTSSLNTGDLKSYAEELRAHRRNLQELEVHIESQDITKTKEYIEGLRNIHSSANKKSVELEKLTTLAINALNDAIQIKPNYPVGDDNEPTFTAPGNKPDIECYYESFNSVCEVTMLTDRSQWYNEGQPVMRHIRDFEDDNPSKVAYGVFVAPRLHQDTAETFWVAVKHGYRGESQKIVPLSITQLARLLEILLEMKGSGKKLGHTDLSDLYDEIIAITNKVSDSGEWANHIPSVIDAWREKMIAK